MNSKDLMVDSVGLPLSVLPYNGGDALDSLVQTYGSFFTRETYGL